MESSWPSQIPKALIVQLISTHPRWIRWNMPTFCILWIRVGESDSKQARGQREGYSLDQDAGADPGIENGGS